MAFKPLYTAVAVVAIAGLSGAAWWYQSRPTAPTEATGTPGPAAAAPRGAASGPAPVRPAGVEVAKVEKTSLQDDAQSVGSLRSRQNVMLRPEVAGRIREIGFKDGAQVRKGQVLVQLDDTLQRAEVKQAQAQVSIAQANFKRNQELVAQNFVAQRVLDESSANLQVAQAQLALAEARLARMAILAPFDATVGLRNINIGDYVKDGADLVNLEDISSMYADFRLPERYQRKLRLQQTVELTLDAFPGRIFKARIEAIDPQMDANGRSVSVRAVLPNTGGEPAPLPANRPGGPGGSGGSGGAPGAAGSAGAPSGAAAAGASPSGKPAAAASATGATGAPAGKPKAEMAGKGQGQGTGKGAQGAQGAKGGPGGDSGARAGGPLRPGMFARVTAIFGVNESALVVPEESIVPQGGRQFVFLVVAPDKVPTATGLPADTQWVSLRREVKLGIRRPGKVEITDGLELGDTVVVAGQQRLQRDGTPLRIVELGRPPGAAGAAAGQAQAPGAAASAPSVPPAPGMAAAPAQAPAAASSAPAKP